MVIMVSRPSMFDPKYSGMEGNQLLRELDRDKMLWEQTNALQQIAQQNQPTYYSSTSTEPWSENYVEDCLVDSNVEMNFRTHENIKLDEKILKKIKGKDDVKREYIKMARRQDEYARWKPNYIMEILFDILIYLTFGLCGIVGPLGDTVKQVSIYVVIFFTVIFPIINIFNKMKMRRKIHKTEMRRLALRYDIMQEYNKIVEQENKRKANNTNKRKTFKKSKKE